MITASQLYYITQVYPEIISAEKSQSFFLKCIKEESDLSYWESAANIVNKITSQPENTVDGAGESRCSHPQGYIKSVRICGLCGEQM